MGGCDGRAIFLSTSWMETRSHQLTCLIPVAVDATTSYTFNMANNVEGGSIIDAAAALDRLHIDERCRGINRSIILCDAFYGFPTQKRPRNERVRAVARQLSNFMQWRSEESLEKQQCGVYFLGEGKDVEAVKARVTELESQTSQTSGPTCEINFQPDIDIHSFLDQQKEIATAQAPINEDVVYLSPDAAETLPATSRPPRIVIVGMLIDRRITEDRSLRRAEDSLKIRAAKLPLDELSVKELSSSEPLNVDTVMELMQRWYWNCDRLEQKLQQISSSGTIIEDDSRLYKKCFLEAAAWSMKSMKDRHPNRTVHKTD
jgi:hypothetical protein